MSSTYIYKVLVFVAAPISWFTNKAAYGFLRLFGVKHEAVGGPYRESGVQDNHGESQREQSALHG